MATARRLGDGIVIGFSSLEFNSEADDSSDDGTLTVLDETESRLSKSPPQATTSESRKTPSPDRTLSRPTTHLYVVTKSHLVRSGKDMTIEPPAIRSEVVALCQHASRARQIAQRTWRRSFAYAIPEGKTEAVDMIGLENRFSDDSVELLRMVNWAFVSEEDGSEVLAGERRVGVWRVRLDCMEGGENGEEDGARTPVSE